MANSFTGDEVRLPGQPDLTVVGVDQPAGDIFTVRVVAQFQPPLGLARMAEIIESAWTLTLILPDGVQVASSGADTGAGPDEMTHNADFDRTRLTPGERQVQITHPDLGSWLANLGLWQ